MPNEPLYYATEDTFVCGARWYQLADTSGDAEDLAVFEAMKQWLRDHSIDPSEVAASYPLTRHEEGIKYYRIDEAGKALAWGVPVEGGPKPWPDSIEVSTPVVAGPPLRVAVYRGREPVSHETWQELEAARDMVAAAGVTVADAIANLERNIAAMNDTPVPLLWEGDQA